MKPEVQCFEGLPGRGCVAEWMEKWLPVGALVGHSVNSLLPCPFTTLMPCYMNSKRVYCFFLLCLPSWAFAALQYTWTCRNGCIDFCCSDGPFIQHPEVCVWKGKVGVAKHDFCPGVGQR